jgi:hypothetical protein
MILRRLTKHVKDQNWFAVALDFVIVVLGILIAFQITNWSEGRGERADARVALQRLEQDYQQILERTDRSLAAQEEFLAALGRVINGIRSGVLNEETLLVDMNEMTSLTLPLVPSTVFAELVSSGRLDLIEDPSLRRALTQHNDFTLFIRDRFAIFDEPITDARDTLLQARTLVVTGIASKELAEVYRTETVDRERLLNDPAMMNALQNAYGSQDNIYFLLARNRTDIQSILEQIKVERERLK